MQKNRTGTEVPYNEVKNLLPVLKQTCKIEILI